MTQSDTQKSAFIRDGALVLYFEMAEKPVIARFDLDTLAQASFEVSAKDKDGFYTIMLNDFSDQSQAVAQFASKGDAHQALYAILQALLSHKEKDAAAQKSCCGCGGFGGFFKGMIRTVLHIVVVMALVYAAMYAYYGFISPALNPLAQQVANKQASTASQNASPDAAPQGVGAGEEMNADDFLSTLTGEQAPAQSSASPDAPSNTQQ